MQYIETAELPIESLTPFPGTPRRGDIAASRESLRATRQYRAIVVRLEPDGTRVILAGNHTTQAAAAGKAAPEDFTEYGEDVETAYCCPSCGYEWSGKPRPGQPAHVPTDT